MKTKLIGGVLLDANHEKEMLDIMIEDGKIVAVGEKLGEADSVIDLSGYTLLPGFIDTHVHVAMKDDCFTEDALLAWAQNGVTTVRELGMLSTMPQEEFAPWILSQNKKPESARLVATGKYIDIAGGYGAGPNPNHCVGNIVRTKEEAEAAVQLAHDLGFPGTKIGIADGMPGAPRMDNEMIHAICEKAKSLGMFTTCHIGKSASLVDMVKSGIGEAAHTPADPMPQSLIEEMVKRGIPMVTTIGDPDKSPAPPDPEEMKELMGSMPPMPPHGMGGGPGGPGGPGGKSPEEKRRENQNMKENCKRLYDAGGKVVIGTDLMRSKNWMQDAKIPTIELRQLCEAGIPFMEVVKSGTKYAAEVVGTAQEEGTIETGKSATLIAVKGDVDETFGALDDVRFVMHYGTIIKNHL